MSTSASFAGLIEHLRRLPEGTPLSQVLALMREPEATSVVETRRRCSLVRSFDADMYAFT